MNTSQKERWLLWTALAVLAVIAAYSNHFGNAFQFDDFHTITDNPSIRSLSNVPRFFTDASTFSVLPANRTYRPFVSTSLAVDYALGHGYVPLWFHLSTFLLFLVLVGLLCAFYIQVLDRTAPVPRNAFLALFAATWFGLHPALAETVNYIIQRGDLYCTLGCVAALVIYAKYKRFRKLGLYLLPLVFALLSKPPAAVFPALVFFYTFFFEEPEGLPGSRRGLVALRSTIPSLLITAALMLLQSRMTPRSFMPSDISAASYRITQPYVWARYFGELFLPVHLNVDSDLTPFSLSDPRALFGLFFLVALGVAIWFASRRRILYPIAYGLIWFVLTQLPTSLYVLSEPENDHRMFFSFAGLMVAVVWGAWLLVERVFPVPQRAAIRPALVAACIIFLGAYAWGTHVRNEVWHTELSLWRDDVAKCPRNGRGLMNYGLQLLNSGDYTGAEDAFTRALQYTPNYPTLQINLGIVEGLLGRSREAEHHFLRAIALAPGDDTAHAFYGRWLSNEGRMNDAVTQLRMAIAENSSRLMPYDVLIDTYTRIGDLQGVRDTALAKLAVAPGDPQATETLAHPPKPDANFWVELSLQQYRAAQYSLCITSARKALEFKPDSAPAYNNIGASYASMQRWDLAVENEKIALRLDPNLQIAKNNLAWAEGSERKAISH